MTTQTSTNGDPKVDDLIRRIERIERRLGIEEAATPAQSTVPETAEGGTSSAAPLAATPSAPPTEPVPAGGGHAPAAPGGAIRPEAAEARARSLEMSAHGTAGAAAPNTPTPARAPITTRARRAAWGEGKSLESVIGGRWFAVLGAVIILVGVGLFLKFAFDQGWIGPAGQCLAVAGFGLVLLGAGEFVRRRVGRVASIGPSAAGLGALFFAAFAAHEVFHLVSLETALGLMVGVTALGVVLGTVVRLASLVAVAMVGGYLAPVLLGSWRPSELFMPSYLLGLLAVGAGSSAWFSTRPEARRFKELHTLGWWGTMVLGSGWLIETGLRVPANGLLFLAAAWVIVHAEMLLASCAPVRARPELVEAGERGDVPGLWRARWIAGSFSTSAWAAVFGVWMMIRFNPTLDWLGTAGVGALCAAGAGMALTLDPIPDVLRRGAHTAREQVGAGLLAEMGALVIATVALALGGWVQVAAWLALGVAAVGTGRWIRAGSLYAYGLVVLSIAAGRLMGLDVLSAWGAPAAWTVAGLGLTTWSAQMGMAGAAWIAASVLLAGDGRRRAVGWAGFVMGVGVALLALAPIHEGTDCAALTLWWAALAIGASAAHRIARRCALDRIGVGVIIAAAVPWMLAYLRDGWAMIDARPGLHPGLGVALVLAACATVFGLLIKRGERQGSRAWAVGVVALAYAGALLFAATSLEVGRAASIVFAGDRTSAAAVLSIWWGLYGVAALALGFARRAAPLRFVGLGLIGLGAVKAVVFDLAQVSQGWRVASFIGLGLLMIGVAVGYAMLARVMGGPVRDSGGGSPDHRPNGDGEGTIGVRGRV